MTTPLADAVRLVVPELEADPFPTLGPQLVDWLEGNLVHGPGDVHGAPLELLNDVVGFVWRAYEVFPPDHPRAGRRRFKREVLSRRKGYAKTELAAALTIAELDPSAPVRCVGWHKVNDRKGKHGRSELDLELVELGYSHGELVPIGGPVRDPYIPLIATTEEQSEDLTYGAVKAILEECELGNGYDLGLERITPRDARGECKAMAGAPSARDGARTTFQVFDETHLYVSERLKQAHRTMLRNVPKRVHADAHSLETTTMYEPGEASTAESSHAYALDVAAGRVRDAALLFDHLQAALVFDLSRRRELIKAIEQASGDALEFADVAAIANEYLDPTADRQKFRRYWLNQRVKGASRWLAPEAVTPLVKPRRRVKADRDRVVLAFDGSYSRDSTALVGCTVEEKPRLWVEGVWEKPLSAGAGEWRAPVGEVMDAVADALERYDVAEFAPDPPGWRQQVEEWEATYGATVVRFETNQPSRMGPAADLFKQGVKDGALTLDGHEALIRHLANAVVKKSRGYELPVKSSDDSPDKIDLAVGAIIAYSRAVWHHQHPPVRRVSWRSL